MTKRWDKSRMPSRHVTVGPTRAPHRSYYYAMGLTEEEIVAALKISPRTVRRDWDLAKAWLLRELSHTMEKQSGP